MVNFVHHLRITLDPLLKLQNKLKQNKQNALKETVTK